MVTESTAKLASDAATKLDSTERRLVASMPLHAIASAHGEADLRQRLLIEIAQFSAVGCGRYGDGLAPASQLHARDRRQRAGRPPSRR